MQALREMIERHDREEAAALGVTVEELRARQMAREELLREEIQARREAEAKERRQQRAAEYVAERALGERLGLGVRVRPAIAQVLSGLSARSAGNGSFRRTVVHLLVQEPFSRGRLQRKAGRFLCRPQPFGFDVSTRDLDTPVTCPRCRTMAGLI